MIPRLRSGTYFPGFLEPRIRSEKALVAVVQAYVNGVSTLKVEWLVGRRNLSEESLQAVLSRAADAETVVEVSTLPAA